MGEITILGHKYQIIKKQGFIAETGGNTGKCNNYSNTITISADLTTSGQNEVLMHEIIEALNYRLELGLEHNKICLLGEVMHQIIKHNNLDFKD